MPFPTVRVQSPESQIKVRLSDRHICRGARSHLHIVHVHTHIMVIRIIIIVIAINTLKTQDGYYVNFFIIINILSSQVKAPVKTPV